jgi:hypothetical protein
MQRFKLHVMKAGNVDKHGQPVVFGAPYGFGLGHRATNHHGKFVYGADGGMTQAARWRIQSMGTAAGIYASGCMGAAETLAADARALLDSSQRGGCRLPT